MKIVEISEDAIVFFECTRCRGSGVEDAAPGQGHDWCSVCCGTGVDSWDAFPLLKSISDAGALCAAFEAGQRRHSSEWLAATDMEMWNPPLAWTPGCGRPLEPS